MFSERQNSPVFDRSHSFFDRNQHQSVNQKVQNYQSELQHDVYMKKKPRRHRQERSQRRERSKSHMKDLELFSSAPVIAVKEELFKPSDIDYFHLNLSNEHEASDYVIVSSKDTIFRDVYMFVQQVKRIVSVKNVSNRLHLCLRGSVMI